MSRIPLTTVPTLLPTLHLNHSALFELGSDIYIYDTVRTNIGIAASASNNSIRFYEAQSLSPKHTLHYHRSRVTQLKSHENSLISSSTDGEVAVWDLRQQLTTPTATFNATEPVLSFDISRSGDMLVAGTQVNDDGVAKICFWDARNAAHLVGCFEDSHSDDVTQIKCHPLIPTQLLSASTDGLVCTYDVREMTEDEAILYVANTNASVSRAGFFGPEAQFIYATSDMETLQLWTNDATMLADFGDVRDVAQSGVPVDYLVDCKYDRGSGRLYLVAGSNSGDLHVLHMGAGSMEHVQTLASGHSEIVRGFDWDLDQGWAVSGGEDGRLSCWSTDAPTHNAHPSVAALDGSKRPSGSRRFAPY